jgi:outer membrane protein OmpA-like peptidoglycan-associated protein
VISRGSASARDLLRVAFMKALTIILGLALAACGASTTTTQTTSALLPPPNANGEYHIDWPSEGSGVPRTITLQLGPDLHQWCRDVSPKFAFDQSWTYVQYKDELVALASCLNKAGLESRNVLLVGRADARGTDSYNLALGERRARAVKDFLVSSGLSPYRISIATEGEREAKAGEPVRVEGQVDPTMPRFEYGYDRRVDVIVTGGAHHP